MEKTMPGRSSLSRLLSPRSVAIIGVSERRRMSNVAVGHLLNASIELYLVSPRAPAAYGRPTFPSLDAIGEPVDAVLSLIGAEASVEVAEQAAALGCGGVVVIASGFAEAGPSGMALQNRLTRLCERTGLAVIGPNCTGFANIPAGVALFTGMPVPVPAGGLSIVSQSGYLTRAAMVAARERNLGVRLAISSGNEAATSVAGYLDFLIDDPATAVICLILETVRDADAFFAAAARARAANKPVIALKLGHSARGREIMQSHTGAITTDSWVYEVGFRQAGLVLAEDLEALLDRSQLLAQLPADRWRPCRDVVMISSSGGVATLASDSFEAQGVRLPPLDQLRARIQETIPGAAYANPLDLTGFAVEPPEVVEGLLETFTEPPAADAVAIGWWLADEDQERAEILLEPLRNVAGRTTIPMIMASVEESRIGGWTTAAGDGLVCFTRGLSGTARALAGMSDHVEFTGVSHSRPRLRALLPRPAAVDSPAGPIVEFAAAMSLLARHGLEVVPHLIVAGPDELSPAEAASLGPELVIKLADIPHRAELGAVRVKVTASQLLAAAEELSGIAAQHRLPTPLAIQPLVAGHSEAFIGIRNHTDLGPVILAGLGGASVESAGQVAGRLLPVSRGDIDAMLDELDQRLATAGRGAAGRWNREAMATAAAGLAELALHAPWLASVDVNPLICTDRSCTAVDVLMVMLPDIQHPDDQGPTAPHGDGRQVTDILPRPQSSQE
jgi:acetate---CoA ligase (ADP-forming)